MIRPPVSAPVGLWESDRRLLLDLLRLPTAGPLEAGPGQEVALWEAQRRYADAAAEIGFEVVQHAAATPADLAGDMVPATVRAAAAADSSFLAVQPSLLLRLGRPLPRAATVMFNVHLDTVAGLEEVSFDGVRFRGRGAIDAKGPAAALLAGVRAARRAQPEIGESVGLLIQAVSGEEGGAMGVFGTRPLVAAGHTGRLNVFCEPTGGRALDRSTAAMTARIRVDGEGAVDDDPGAGDNATVLLGFLAQHIATACGGSEGQTCVAGMHTGTMHNRVYGSGNLLLNMSYGSSAAADRIRRRLEEAVCTGLDEFATRFAGLPGFRRTAAHARAVTTLEWLKQGLPALTGDDRWLDALLTRAGVDRWPAGRPAFTCDAIWMSEVPGTSTLILGPGDLTANHAHAAGEYADLTDLDDFAADVAGLLAAFTAERYGNGDR